MNAASPYRFDEGSAVRVVIADDEPLARERLQSLLADQRNAEAQIELCRSQHGEASELLGKTQAESYRIGGESVFFPNANS